MDEVVGDLKDSAWNPAEVLPSRVIIANPDRSELGDHSFMYSHVHVTPFHPSHLSVGNSPTNKELVFHQLYNLSLK